AIDPDYPPERIEWMIQSSKPTCLLTHRHLYDSFHQSGSCQFLTDRTHWIAIDDASTAAAAPVLANSEPAQQSCGSATVNADENAAYIIFTSGSTGMPKGVMVGHRQVIQLLDAVLPQLRSDHTDVWTLFHSLAF